MLFEISVLGILNPPSGGQGWRQAVVGYVSADDMAGADQEVGLPLGE